MSIVLDETFEDNRLGVSFLKLENFSMGDIERSINAIHSAMNNPYVGTHKRIIKDFEYREKERELIISAILEVPLNVKELVVEGDKLKIKERTDYYTRKVQAIIRIDKGFIIILSQNVLGVREFSKYLREITVMKFNPVPIHINQDKMRKLINEFESIYNLKILMAADNPIKFIRFNGIDLIDSPDVQKIISDEENEITEIAGIESLSNEIQVKLQVNNRGRVSIYKNSGEIDGKDIYNWLRYIESRLL